MTAVGIDLGTTNSCVAVWRGGKVEVLPGADGQPITPSWVAESEKGEWTTGMFAKRMAETNPRHTYRAVKRLIGRAFEDPQVGMVQEVSAFAIAPADNGEAWIDGRESLLAPAFIQAHILRRLKGAAELALGKPITQAVVTVPAYFNDAQRKATLEAGEIAGLKVLRIINEPTAAAFALELDRADEPRTVAIYDLGGGTFDLSLLSIDGDNIEVSCSNGDTFLGGEDWDHRLLDHLADEFMAGRGVTQSGSDKAVDVAGFDPRKDPLCLQRLKLAAEAIKIDLSFGETAEHPLPRFALVGVERTPVDFMPSVTRTQLENLTADLVTRTTELCTETLADAGLTVDQIDLVVLVGGQTRAPAVQAAVRALFPGRPMISPDPDQIVARGAAIMAAALTGALARDLEDVTPFAIGVQAFPPRAHPDADAGEAMVVIVPANHRIPCHIAAPFTVQSDDQEAVTVRLRQGNSDDVRENLPLGRFDLEGVRAKDGRKIIDVTVDIDADGVMTASARDRGSGRTQALTVDTMGLSPRAIDRMRKQTAAAGRTEDAINSAAGAQT